MKAASIKHGITEKKLRAMCRENRIDHIKLDYRNYRFSQKYLEEYMTAFQFHRKSVYR